MKRIYCVLVFSVFIVTVIAHEYVLLAVKFRLKKGDKLEMHLFVADGFNIQLEKPFQKSITQKFELITKDSIINLLPLTPEGALPVINKEVNFDGGGLVHTERGYAHIVLATDKFFDYLKEDHIDGIAGIVDKTKPVQKERYSRYIKSLVQSGDIYTDTLYKLFTGQHFEIIFLQNPYRLHPGGLLKAQVFFMGKPLPDKIITAENRVGNKPVITLASKTDDNGVCSFKLVRKGEWFLHATHMIVCPDKQDSDWESFWTSYSFGID